jgi:hypothetical protein
MLPRVLRVEDRVRVILVYLDALKSMAVAMDGPADLQPFHDLPEFAAWVARLSEYALLEVRAIRGVLPESAMNLEAPGQTGAVS